MTSVRDTSPDIDHLQIVLFRQAPIEKHIRLMRSLTNTVLSLSQKAIREENPNLDYIAISTKIVATYYDVKLAEDFCRYLTSNKKSGEYILNSIDLFQALIPIVEIFEKLNINYHIDGSFASSAHGVPRATADIDLMADIRLEQINALINALGIDYYIEENSVKRAIQNSSSFNLIHQDTIIKVDIFIPKDREYDQEVMRRAISTSIDIQNPRSFKIKSAEDIILTKLEWYRSSSGISEVQWRDIINVFRVRKDSIDYDYLDRWATKLQLKDLLTKV